MYLRLGVVTLGLTALFLLQGEGVAAESSAAGQPAKRSVVERAATKEIDDLLAGLKKALVEADAQAVADCWDQDGIFIDESGEETHGRTALQQRFDLLFKSRPEGAGRGNTAAMNLEPESASFPAENVATVVGAVSKPAGRGSIAATRFSIVARKEAGKWLIIQATETRIAANDDAQQHLNELGWLLGKWKTSGKNGSATMQVEWAPGRNFLKASSASTEGGGSDPKTDTQVIGWDQRTGSIVSWYFGYYGNFSTGKWKRIGGGWQVDIDGVNSDGSSMHQTDVYSETSSGKFKWQSKNRVRAGTNLADTEQLTVEKVAGEQI